MNTDRTSVKIYTKTKCVYVAISHCKVCKHGGLQSYNVSHCYVCQHTDFQLHINCQVIVSYASMGGKLAYTESVGSRHDRLVLNEVLFCDMDEEIRHGRVVMGVVSGRRWCEAS